MDAALRKHAAFNEGEQLVWQDTQVLFAVCVEQNRKNIERMLAGEEHPTSIKEMVVKLKAKKLKAKEEQK